MITRLNTLPLLLFLIVSAAALVSTVVVGDEEEYYCPPPDETMLNTGDYFPYKIKPAHSQQWDISYHGSYKVLTNKIVNERYLLYHCAAATTKSSLLEEVNNLDEYNVVTPVPLPNGIALTSTVQIPMLELLGLRKEIKTYIGDDSYISSPCLKKLIDDEVTSVFQPDDNNTMESWILESDNVNRIIIGNSWGYGATSNSTLVEHGHEEGPNKAVFEWIYFYASLYNLEGTIAKSIFDETADRYDCVAENAAVIMSDDDSRNKRPIALWAYRSYFEGYEGWHVATCSPTENYYCEYARLCSTDLLSLPESDKVLTDDEFLTFGKLANVFFYMSTDWTNVYANHTDILKEFVSVQNRQVYDYQGSGSNSWFEQRMAEYDVVLEDFCTVVNMTTDASLHKRKWFRNVYTEPIGELIPCDANNVYAPLETQATPCIRLGAAATAVGVEGVIGDEEKEKEDSPTGTGEGGGGDEEEKQQQSVQSETSSASSLSFSFPSLSCNNKLLLVFGTLAVHSCFFSLT